MAAGEITRAMDLRPIRERGLFDEPILFGKAIADQGKIQYDAEARKQKERLERQKQRVKDENDLADDFNKEIKLEGAPLQFSGASTRTYNRIRKEQDDIKNKHGILNTMYAVRYGQTPDRTPLRDPELVKDARRFAELKNELQQVSLLNKSLYDVDKRTREAASSIDGGAYNEALSNFSVGILDDLIDKNSGEYKLGNNINTDLVAQKSKDFLGDIKKWVDILDTTATESATWPSFPFGTDKNGIIQEFKKGRSEPLIDAAFNYFINNPQGGLGKYGFKNDDASKAYAKKLISDVLQLNQQKIKSFSIGGGDGGSKSATSNFTTAPLREIPISKNLSLRPIGGAVSTPQTSTDAKNTTARVVDDSNSIVLGTGLRPSQTNFGSGNKLATIVGTQLVPVYGNGYQLSPGPGEKAPAGYRLYTILEDSVNVETFLNQLADSNNPQVALNAIRSANLGYEVERELTDKIERKKDISQILLELSPQTKALQAVIRVLTPSTNELAGQWWSSSSNAGSGFNRTFLRANDAEVRGVKVIDPDTKEAKSIKDWMSAALSQQPAQSAPAQAAPAAPAQAAPTTKKTPSAYPVK